MYEFQFKCPKPFNELVKESNQSYFCDTCDKCVYDLSNKKESEVEVFLIENEGACVRLPKRFVVQDSQNRIKKEIYNWVQNYNDTSLKKWKSKPLFILILPLMLLTGCHAHAHGKLKVIDKKPKKNVKQIKSSESTIELK